MKERNAGTYIILFFLIVPAMFSLFFIHLKMNEIVSHQKRKGNRWAFFCSFIWAHLLFPFSLLAHNLMPGGKERENQEKTIIRIENSFVFSFLFLYLQPGIPSRRSSSHFLCPLAGLLQMKEKKAARRTQRKRRCRDGFPFSLEKKRKRNGKTRRKWISFKRFCNIFFFIVFT